MVTHPPLPRRIPQAHRGILHPGRPGRGAVLGAVAQPTPHHAPGQPGQVVRLACPAHVRPNAVQIGLRDLEFVDPVTVGEWVNHGVFLLVARMAAVRAGATRSAAHSFDSRFIQALLTQGCHSFIAVFLLQVKDNSIPFIYVGNSA